MHSTGVLCVWRGRIGWLIAPLLKSGVPLRGPWVRIPPSPQIETSRFERTDARRAPITARDNFSRRFAANWLGGGNSKRADLSRTKGFVPIFWTNDLIWYKSEEEDKKLACFVSKIHSECRIPTLSAVLHHNYPACVSDTRYPISTSPARNGRRTPATRSCPARW